MAAVTADKVVVELELKDGEYIAKVRKNESAFVRSQRNTARAAEDAERRIRASSQGISNALRASAASIAAGVSVAAITRLADSYTSMQNRLRVTGLEAEGLAYQFDRLNQVADDSRSPLEGVVGVYSRLRIATEGLGFTNAEVTRTTEILTKALRASGATAQEASAALLQFGQGVGSGALQGDELRSIRENAPLVARAIADEFNTTVGGLKKLGEEGKLTSERVVRAVLASGQAIDAAWQKTDATVGDALTNLQNRMVRYIGETDKSLGATKRFVAAVGLIADNIDKIVPSLSLLVVLMGARLVGATAGAALAAGAKAVADTRAAAASVAHTRAMEAQAAATARLTALGGGATAAITAQATATTVATTAAARAGAGLTALAGGPVGLATVAFTALVAAIIYGNRALENLVKPTEASEKATRALDIATRNYTDAANKAAEATGKEAEAARRAAAEKKALAEAALEAARAKLAEAQATVALIAAEGRRKIEAETFNTRGDRAGTTNPFGNNRGTLLQAQADAKALQEIVDSAKESIDQANAALRAGSSIAPPGGDGTGQKGKTAEQLAKEAEQRARLLVDIEREAKIEEATLALSVARVRELEREAEIEARIRQLKDAGFSAEEAQAFNTQIQSRLDAARAKDMERRAELQQRGIDLTLAEINENYEIQRSLEKQTEYESLLAAHKETSLSTTEAEAKALADVAVLEEARNYAAERYLKSQSQAHALRIAELTGNKELANSMRDQEAILARTNELRRQSNGLLTEAQARSQATAEVAAERSATTYGEQRDFFASTFSEGIRAAMAGDLNGFLASQFGNLADAALQKLGESLFDSFTNAPAAVAQAQVEGVTQGAAIAATVTPAITAAGGAAAAAMGGAILTSGTTVAGLIAQAMAAGNVSSAISGFGGFRAAGGPVRAGMSYQVGERGAETFVPSQNGYIIPNMKNASAAPGMSGMVKIVVGEGEMFTARVTEIAGPLSIQTAATSAAYSQDQMVKSQKRSGQRIF